MRPATTLAIALLLVVIMGAAVYQLFLQDPPEATCVRTSIPNVPTTLAWSELAPSIRDLPECPPPTSAG